MKDKIEIGKIMNSYKIYLIGPLSAHGIGVGVIKDDNNKFKCKTCGNDNYIENVEHQNKNHFPNNLEFKSTGKLYCLFCCVNKIDLLASEGAFDSFELI